MPPAKSQKTSKLRASCDGCHQAKLKCHFDDPLSCARCRKQNTSCIRSPSMPLGRSPGSRNKRKVPPRDYPSPTDTTPPPVSETSTSAGSSSATSDRRELRGSKVFEPFTSLQPTESLPDLDCTTLDAPFSELNFGWCEPEISCIRQMDTIPTSTAPPRVEDVLGIPDCDCHASIIRGVKQSWHQLSWSASVSIDNVLHSNKLNLALLEQFLACRAVHDVSLVLQALIFLRRTLAAYTEMWFVGCMPIHAVRRSDSEFRFGSYVFDEQDEHVLKQRIVLLNLQKFIPLLDRLAERAVENSGDDERRVLVSMHDFLKKEAEEIAWRMAETGF